MKAVIHAQHLPPTAGTHFPRNARHRTRDAALLTTFAITLYLLLCPCSLTARQDAWNEHQIKAVFVYNLTFFVFWNKTDLGTLSTPFRILNLGNEEMETVLETVVKKESILGHAISAEHTPLHSLSEYRIIFVPETMTRRTAHILSQTRESKTLLVGETMEFLEQGGMISFICTGHKIKTYINQDALRRADIRISAKLYQISHPAQDVWEHQQ